MNEQMTDTKLRLILFGSDPAALERLKAFSEGMPYIGYEVGHGPQVAANARLDALWLTLMEAVELFGAAPPFPLYEARVLKTPHALLERRFPRYAVVGVAISQDDPKTPDWELRLVMSALLKAVREFNSRNEDQILRIGILPED